MIACKSVWIWSNLKIIISMGNEYIYCACIWSVFRIFHLFSDRFRHGQVSANVEIIELEGNMGHRERILFLQTISHKWCALMMNHAIDNISIRHYIWFALNRMRACVLYFKSQRLICKKKNTWAGFYHWLFGLQLSMYFRCGFIFLVLQNKSIWTI